MKINTKTATDQTLGNPMALRQPAEWFELFDLHDRFAASGPNLDELVEVLQGSSYSEGIGYRPARNYDDKYKVYRVDRRRKCFDRDIYGTSITSDQIYVYDKSEEYSKLLEWLRICMGRFDAYITSDKRNDQTIEDIIAVGRQMQLPDSEIAEDLTRSLPWCFRAELAHDIFATRKRTIAVCDVRWPSHIGSDGSPRIEFDVRIDDDLVIRNRQEVWPLPDRVDYDTSLLFTDDVLHLDETEVAAVHADIKRLTRSRQFTAVEVKKGGNSIGLDLYGYPLQPDVLYQLAWTEMIGPSQSMDGPSNLHAHEVLSSLVGWRDTLLKESSLSEQAYILGGIFLVCPLVSRGDCRPQLRIRPRRSSLCRDEHPKLHVPLGWGQPEEIPHFEDVW